MPVPIEDPTTALAVLRQRPLLLFVGSRFFSGLASTLLRATISWQVYEISQSAFHLGMVGLVQFVPVLFLNLLGGAAADAWDRKRLAMLGQAVTAHSAIQMGAFMSGPVVMGFAIAVGGVTLAYVLHASAIAVALLTLSFAKVLRAQEKSGRVTWAATSPAATTPSPARSTTAS